MMLSENGIKNMIFLLRPVPNMRELSVNLNMVLVILYHRQNIS